MCTVWLVTLCILRYCSTLELLEPFPVNRGLDHGGDRVNVISDNNNNNNNNSYHLSFDDSTARLLCTALLWLGCEYFSEIVRCENHHVPTEAHNFPDDSNIDRNYAKCWRKPYFQDIAKFFKVVAKTIPPHAMVKSRVLGTSPLARLAAPHK